MYYIQVHDLEEYIQAKAPKIDPSNWFTNHLDEAKGYKTEAGARRLIQAHAWLQKHNPKLVWFD